MSTSSTQVETNEEFVWELTDAIWSATGSPDAVDNYFAEDVVHHETDGIIEGRAAYKEYQRALRRGMPDFDCEVELLVCDGDTVAVRYVASGTHSGDLWGLEPTGTAGELVGHAFFRIVDGEVVESWNQYDRLGMFQQLGVIPDQPTG